MDERRAAIIESANRVQALLDADSELEIVTTNPASDEIATWQRHADLLLAEERAAAAPERAVDLPEHLSASALVSLVQDAREFALRSEEHTSELQSRGHLVCRLLLEKKKHKCRRHMQ